MRFAAAILTVLALGFAPAAAAQVWRTEQVDDLVAAAQAAPLEGLQVPETALASVLTLRFLREFDPSVTPAFNLAAESLFLELAQSYARGAVDPTVVDRDWHIARPSDPDRGALDAAVHAGKQPSVILAGLLPQSREYQALRTELARLRAAPGEAETTAHLTQVLANLERWRWLPRNLPARRIEVRLAQFELQYFDGVNETPTHYDVIVGSPRTPSPTFGAMVESVTLNPDWDPPASIVARELLPRFRRNPAQASQEGYDVLDLNGGIVDPRAVDWQARPFPYRLRQRPGPRNALGRLRFDMPNPYSVYLHDTPSQALFLRDSRALSHGCIRVKSPAALAASLLGGTWSEAAVTEAIDQGASQTLILEQPTPVYLLYLTAAVDSDGAVVYLGDIHRRDRPLADLLNGAPMRTTMAEADSSCAS